MQDLYKIVGAAIGVEPTDFTDESKAAEIQEKLNGLKVFTSSSYADALNSYRANLSPELVPDKVKQAILKREHPNLKASILEAQEKELAKSYGIEEFTGLTDLVSKVHEKASAAKGDGQSAELVTQLQKKIQDLNTEKQSEIEAIQSKAQSQIKNMTIASALNSYKEKLNVPTESKDAFSSTLGIQFQSDYKLEQSDNNGFIVKNTAGEIVTNKDGQPISITEAVDMFVQPYLAKDVPKDARGANSGVHKKQSGSIDFKSYAKAEDFRAEHIDGKEVTADEAFQLMQDYYKSQAE